MEVTSEPKWRASWVALPAPMFTRDDYRPCPTLRGAFGVASVPTEARLFVTALGLYRAFLNGVRVGVDELTPGWTDYRQRVNYQAYDVSRLLFSDTENTLEIQLAHGWYAGYLGTDRVRERYGSELAAFAQLEVDGEPLLCTDSTWTGSYAGLLASDPYLGETYDSRIPASPAAPVRVLDPQPSVRLAPQIGPPVRDGAPLTPISTQELRAGHLLVDFGVNIAGRVRIRVTGRPGDEITIRHGEMLQAGGSTLYVDHLRHARASDTYVLSGVGTEEWQPAFTYHGFRYVDVVGLGPDTVLDSISAVPLGSFVTPVGSFQCSEERVNRLHDAVVQTFRNNWVDLPTDCPNRDERLGWTGDAYISATTGTYLFDSTAFYESWLENVIEAQTPEGLYTDVAPAVPPWDVRAAPGWGDGALVVAWTLHLFTGDKRILARQLPHMRRWVDAAVEANPSLIWENERGQDYGDWLTFDDTSREIFSTAILAESAAMVAASAFAVGDTGVGTDYAHLAARIRAAFAARFASELSTQTALVLALKFRLLDGPARSAAATALAADVRARGSRLSTGFFGTEHLLTVLAENGEADLAYDLLLSEEQPSWLYFLAQGATTMWEHWDSWTEEAGFKDPFMNSFSHTSLGSVGRFLYETVGGIRPDPTAPGFARVLLTPIPGRGIDWAEASYNSVHGPITTRWERTGSAIALSVSLSPTCEGVLRLPGQPDVVLAAGRHELTLPARDSSE